MSADGRYIRPGMLTHHGRGIGFRDTFNDRADEIATTKASSQK